MMDLKQNTKQKRIIISIFDQFADGYDNPAQRCFPFFADQLVTELQPQRGQKILDVATGSGAAATAAAQATGPEGRISGIDLSENMLVKAEQNIHKMSLQNIDLHQMDGEALEFKSLYFDAVISNFCLCFFPDTLAALKQWCRVLKPGGKVMFTSFHADAFQPMVKVFQQQLLTYNLENQCQHALCLDNIEACQELLKQAGFVEFKIQIKNMSYHLPNIDEWWDLLWTSGYGLALTALTPEQQLSFRSEYQTKMRNLADENGLRLNVVALFSSARRPENV